MQIDYSLNFVYNGLINRKKGVQDMKQITNIRKAVATMANQLHKLGYSLSQAFKDAWKRIKESMTCNVSGVTYENRQQLLQFIATRKPENLTIYLRRDRANTYDRYAIAVVVGIHNIRYAHIGYLPKGVAQSMAAVIDKGIELKASLTQIIGGYGWKENYGALINIAI